MPLSKNAKTYPFKTLLTGTLHNPQIQEATGATVAWTKLIRSDGEISNCRPRTPALMYMVSKSVAVLCMYVGKRFFIPIGEQPPLM